MNRKQLGMKIRNHFDRKYAWWLRSVWVLLLVAFIVIFCIYPLNAKRNPSKIEDLIVYSAERDRVVTWNRDKAIEFGLSQTATIINYLFLAAGAVLGVVGKLMLDPLISTEKDRVAIQQPASTLLRHVAIGCFFSMFYGFIGLSSIALLPAAVDFAPFEVLGLGAAFQQISFLLAIALFMAAASIMLKKGNIAKEHDK